MFIPIGDENPTERRPYVNYALIAINVLVFLGMLAADDEGLIRWTMVPAELRWPTLFTSLFMHAGWAHLIGNMLFLWIFGDNIEDKLGHIGYPIFYLAAGLAADAAHILSNPGSTVPTLGASGAISGVMGAYVVLFPRHHVKVFVWLGIFFADVIRTPAFLWIGFWFIQQVVLNAIEPSGGGGVAYFAHIGGFVVGAATAGGLLLLGGRWGSMRPLADRLDRRPGSERKLFSGAVEDPGIVFEDADDSGYSVLRLTENAADVAPIAEIVSRTLGEMRLDVVRRLETTRGMVVRSVPREAAARIQQELHAQGIASAIIVHNRTNFAPRPLPVEGASWDDWVLRLRAGDQIVQLRWSAPFLYVAARVEGRALLDIYVDRRTAYRIVDARSVPLTMVDPTSRKEISTDLSGFARAALHLSRTTFKNEGVELAKDGAGWGRLDFKSAQDYDDYIFWLYNLMLAQGPRT